MERNYYTVIPSKVLLDDRLKDKAKLLYGEISSLCNEKGFCWANNEYFASRFGVAKETISRLITDLKDAKYIYVNYTYKPGTLALDQRCISLRNDPYPIDENINSPLTKSSSPLDQMVNDPLIKTSNIILHTNITSNITSNSKENQVKENWFEEFWKAYPNKKDKKNAKTKFMKACKDESVFANMMAALSTQKESVDWKKQNGRFIPMPSTWINGERWKDEVEENARTTKPVAGTKDKFGIPIL